MDNDGRSCEQKQCSYGLQVYSKRSLNAYTAGPGVQAMTTYFGKYNSTGSIGCGFLILLCLLACACSSSKHSVQSPIIDDFERSGLNAMALRLPAPAMTSLQQALRNYQSLDDLRGQWRVHWAMARIYLSQGDTVAAAHNITAMEMLAPQIDDDPIYYHTAILVGQLGDESAFEQALVHSSNALQRAVAQTYLGQYALAFKTLDHDAVDFPADRAFVYFRYGFYANSEADMQRALEFYRRAGDTRGIADSLLRLADMSLQAGDRPGARAFSQRALLVLTASGDTARAASVQAWIEARL